METIGDRVRRARKAADLDKATLGRRVGMTGAGIGQIESGATKSPKPENLVKIADALRVDFRWLTTGKGPHHLSQVKETEGVYNVEPEAHFLIEQTDETDPRLLGKVPLISWVTAGQADLAIDLLTPGDAEEWLYCNARHSANTYALEVRGDSMTSPYGRSFPDGCIIFVDPEQRGGLEPGDPIIAKINGVDAVTFKILARDDGRAFLKPLNPQYPALHDEFRPLGKVIEKQEVLS